MSHVLISAAVIVSVVLICTCGMHLSYNKVRSNKFKELILVKFRTKVFTMEDLLQELPSRSRRQLYWFILRQEILGRINSEDGRYRLTVAGHTAYTDQIRDRGGYRSHPLIA